MLTWDAPTERLYEHGIDRGVLYPSNVPPGPVVVTNLVDDPVPTAIRTGHGGDNIGGVQASRWFGGGGGTYSVVTGATPVGNTFVRKTWTGAGTNPGDTGFDVGIDAANYGKAMVAGDKMYVGFWMRSSRASQKASTSVYYTEPGAREFTAGASINLLANVWTWCKFLVTVSGAYHLASIAMDISSAGSANWQVGDTLDIAGPTFSINQDFDKSIIGSMANDGLYSYDWKGNANASMSERRRVVDTAFAWNGLTGFDEAGNGSADVMYRDGKIYLADMDPTDFSGKLSAFSFPDAFYACIGQPEAAEGFRADNQKPQRFSLSYRTLIGSGAVGDLFGYQIHLIYNCMASIDTKSRKTASDQAQLVEFGFPVVCTPKRLPGFRPTAHFIIDTRTLGATTVATLEAMLYGSDSMYPRMPEPQDIFDLLNFGDTIKFYDNGDGTWYAVGSSKNLTDNGDGTWDIQNVIATDHGNGTYTADDTP